MRIFVAVEVSDDVREAVARALPKLKAAAPDSRFVKPEKLHMTLQFLGGVEDDKVAPISEALDQIAKKTAPFELGYAGGGCFGTRVLWIGAEGDVDALKTLQKKVEAALRPLGFEPEKRAHSPHLTLARAKEFRGDKALKDAVALLEEFYVAPSEVARLVLMQSVQNKEGGEYRVLHAAPFA